MISKFEASPGRVLPEDQSARKPVCFSPGTDIFHPACQAAHLPHSTSLPQAMRLAYEKCTTCQTSENGVAILLPEFGTSFAGDVLPPQPNILLPNGTVSNSVPRY